MMLLANVAGAASSNDWQQVVQRYANGPGTSNLCAAAVQMLLTNDPTRAYGKRLEQDEAQVIANNDTTQFMEFIRREWQTCVIPPTNAFQFLGSNGLFLYFRTNELSVNGIGILDAGTEIVEAYISGTVAANSFVTTLSNLNAQAGWSGYCYKKPDGPNQLLPAWLSAHAVFDARLDTTLWGVSTNWPPANSVSLTVTNLENKESRSRSVYCTNGLWQCSLFDLLPTGTMKFSLTVRAPGGNGNYTLHPMYTGKVWMLLGGRMLRASPVEPTGLESILSLGTNSGAGWSFAPGPLEGIVPGIVRAFTNEFVERPNRLGIWMACDNAAFVSDWVGQPPGKAGLLQTFLKNCEAPRDSGIGLPPISGVVLMVGDRIAGQSESTGFGDNLDGLLKQCAGLFSNSQPKVIVGQLPLPIALSPRENPAGGAWESIQLAQARSGKIGQVWTLPSWNVPRDYPFTNGLRGLNLARWSRQIGELIALIERDRTGVWVPGLESDSGYGNEGFSIRLLVNENGSGEIRGKMREFASCWQAYVCQDESGSVQLATLDMPPENNPTNAFTLSFTNALRMGKAAVRFQPRPRSGTTGLTAVGLPILMKEVQLPNAPNSKTRTH